MTMEIFAYLNGEYDYCHYKEQPSIDLLRLPPRPYTRAVSSIHPFTLICPITIFWPSMREGPCAIHHSIEPTALKSILNSLDCILFFVFVQPRPLLLQSA